MKVKRRTRERICVGVVAFDVLALIVVLLIGTYAAWTPGAVSEDGSLPRLMFDTWLLWGLVPAFLLSVAAFAPWEVED